MSDGRLVDMESIRGDRSTTSGAGAVRYASLALLFCIALVAAGCGGSSSSSPSPSARVRERSGPVPQMTGPITGGAKGFPQTSSAIDLTASNYVEEEFLLSGTATSYDKAGEWGEDGRWNVRAAQSAPYTTRILVRRPADASRFSGTVVVEWLNASSQVDVDVDFGYLAEEIIRTGDAWVGVTAQAIPVNSTGGSQFGASAVGLKAWDPQRYGTLVHPGDDYSYDIFSQAGRVVAAPDGPLAGYRVSHLLADGESQSAHRMVTYVNAVAPVADVYDGYLIHSRFGNSAPLSGTSFTSVPTVVRVRDDLRVPVLQVMTETDLYALAATSNNFATPFPPARQPDSEWLRTWEIAGTAHADGDYLRLLSIQGKRQFPGFLELGAVSLAANNGPQKYVMRSALRALQTWVIDGVAPANFDVIEVTNGAIVRDPQGNARGGLRTPQVDVPVAVLSGEGAQTIGKTVPFTNDVLVALYGTPAAYQRSFAAAVDRAIAAGAFLDADAPSIIAESRTVTFG